MPGEHVQTHRLFFALMPDDEVLARLRRLSGWLQERHPELHAHWVKPERFHATLYFLGDYSASPDEAIACATAAANRLSASSFDWTLDEAASFRGRQPPCILRCTSAPAELPALWRALGEAWAMTGQARRSERQYVPHVTLAYARRELPAPVPIEPIAWHADSFVLIHSVVGKGLYRFLGRWRLLP